MGSSNQRSFVSRFFSSDIVRYVLSTAIILSAIAVAALVYSQFDPLADLVVFKYFALFAIVMTFFTYLDEQFFAYNPYRSTAQDQARRGNPYHYDSMNFLNRPRTLDNLDYYTESLATQRRTEQLLRQQNVWGKHDR